VALPDQDVAKPSLRREPVGACADRDLLVHIKAEIEASFFHGEGYRKIWARLRYKGVRTAAPAGRLFGVGTIKTVRVEQMEISRLKAELARTRMERDILIKATAYFAKESSSGIAMSGRSWPNAGCLN